MNQLTWNVRHECRQLLSSILEINLRLLIVIVLKQCSGIIFNNPDSFDKDSGKAVNNFRMNGHDTGHFYK